MANMNIINSIRESSIPSQLQTALADPGYLNKTKSTDEVDPNSQAFQVQLIECEATIAVFFNAIAVCLGSNKDPEHRIWLKIENTDGKFIMAAYIELDKTTNEWSLGFSFDASDIEKVDPKWIISHDDPGHKFAGSVKSPWFFESYVHAVCTFNKVYDNLIITTTAQVLRNVLETNASENGTKLIVTTELPDEYIDSSLKASMPDQFSDPTATTYVEKLGEFICKSTKTGPSITFTPGETITPFIKDDMSVSILNAMEMLGNTETMAPAAE